MKYTLKRDTSIVENSLKCELSKLDLDGIELIDLLRDYLSIFMEGILDPDVRGKKPDKFLENLQSGRLGDFCQRYIITANDGEKVVGLLIALPHISNQLHIYSICISPEYRNRGVGSDLLRRCINDAAVMGIAEILLDVHSENLPALGLYRKFGFVEKEIC